jgi:hypothetical protein
MYLIDFSKKIAALRKNDNSDIMIRLIQAKQQYQIFHWQTNSYSEHKAFDSIYDSLGDLVDKFMEVYMGKYGRIILSDDFSFNLKNYNQDNPITFTNEFIQFLSNDIPYSLEEKDTDLFNIRDEMLGNLNQLKYLLTLK